MFPRSQQAWPARPLANHLFDDADPLAGLHRVRERDDMSQQSPLIFHERQKMAAWLHWNESPAPRLLTPKRNPRSDRRRAGNGPSTAR